MSDKKLEKYNLQLTKEHLEVISRALEVFARAQMGQFKFALELIFSQGNDKEYCKLLQELNWDKLQALEDILKINIFKRGSKLQRAHTFLSITGASNSAKVAYETQQAVKQFLAVKNNDGYWGVGRSFDNPLSLSGQPTPKIKEFQKYKDFPIPDKHHKKLNQLFAAGKYFEMWEIVSPYIPKDVEGVKQIYPFCEPTAAKDMNGDFFEDPVLRIWMPRIIEDDEF